jgi:NAD(P)-dependent dehydrogenase (short-subunit alcohol dehydrogenase family)
MAPRRTAQLTPVAVLTGGSGGMAMACARRFRDHHLLLAARSAERLDAAVGRLRAEGLRADACRCDVTDPESVRRLAVVAADIGPLSALVHTAGMPAPMGDSRLMLEVNFCGTVHVLDAFEPLVTHGTAGVLVASIGAHRTFAARFDEVLLTAGEPGFMERMAETGLLAESSRFAYAVAKRGVVLLAQQRARAWGKRGGRLVSISPALISDTNIGKSLAGGAVPSFSTKTYPVWSAVGRAGRADDIAAVIAFLCSPDASFVTGTDLLVDGGLFAHIERHLDAAGRAAWHAHAFAG